MMLLELGKNYPELEMGYYYHFANSMHIYKKNFNVFDYDLKKDDSEKMMMPEVNNLSEIKELIMLENSIRSGSEINYNGDSLLVKRCLSFLQSN